MLYVIDGRVATSAGIASGIDLALHLIAVRDGPAIAARVAREMVVYARRNGDERQASAMLRHRNHLSDTAHRAQDHIEARFAAPAARSRTWRPTCGVSERTLTRRFTEATGLTPLRYQQVLRLERAEHLIGHGATVEAAARAVGFQDARMLRRLRTRDPGKNSLSPGMRSRHPASAPFTATATATAAQRVSAGPDAMPAPPAPEDHRRAAPAVHRGIPGCRRGGCPRMRHSGRRSGSMSSSARSWPSRTPGPKATPTCTRSERPTWQWPGGPQDH